MSGQPWRQHSNVITQAAIQMVQVRERNALLNICPSIAIDLTGVVGQKALLAVLLWYNFIDEKFEVVGPTTRVGFDIAEMELTELHSRLDNDEIALFLEDELTSIKDVSENWLLPSIAKSTQEKIVIVFRTSFELGIHSPLHILIVEHDTANSFDNNDHQALYKLCSLMIANIQRIERENLLKAVLTSTIGSLLPVHEDIPSALGAIRDAAEDLDPDRVNTPAEARAKIRTILEAHGRINNKLSYVLEQKIEEPCQLNEIVRELTWSLLRSNGAKVELQPLPSSDIYIWAKPEHLRYALREIVKNAMSEHNKHNINKPIVVSAKIIPGNPVNYVQVSVVDHAKGIPPRIKQAIMVGWSPRKNRGMGEGLGIGFALSRAITHLYGGDITIEKTSKEGTTICLHFPIFNP